MAKNFFSLKPRNVMWWWPLFICVLFLRERYYRYLTEKAEKYSWGRKNDKLFSFESKLSIVFHPSIIGEYLFCLLQIFSTMGLFFQRKLCLKIDQSNTTYISKLICIGIYNPWKSNWYWKLRMKLEISVV